MFAAPERKGAALSPDGKWIGYLVAMETGGYDLVAAAADDLVDVRKLARGVDDFAWVGSLALYRDAAGYHVADPQTPDPDTPRAVLAGDREAGGREAAATQRLEALRERLLGEGDAALNELVAARPGLDRRHLRALVRRAREERAAGKPLHAYRELFRALREPE